LVGKAKGAEISEDELKQFCLANAPAYAHPRRIDFIAELPLNGPGKIDRKVVQRLMRERCGVLG
jgi:long-chain acyl-CoA synthetase